MRKRLTSILLLSAVLLLAAGPKKLPKPGFNLFSKDQDIQLGREAAQQIEQQYRVIDNKQLTDYINRVGMRLVQQGGLDDYPFFFKVVQDDSINAFALPGGPMYVHTGLIKAAETEGQLAGVLAHELSHVVLRHGTNQASKAQGLQIIAGLGGAMAGGGMLGQLANMGIGLGANSVLMKFSRGAESDADLLGMHTMAKAGYNPIEMARFFEKLEAEAPNNSKLTEFFASHPNPGNRVKAIETEIQYLPKSSYTASEGNLAQMRSLVDKLPAAPKPKPGQQGVQQGGQQVPPPQVDKQPQIQLSGRMQTFQGGGVSFSYPEGWQRIGQSQNGVTFAPQEGVVGSGENSALGYAVIAGAAQAQNGRVDLQRDTQAMLQALVQQNPGARVEANPGKITIGGSNGLVTRLSANSPYKGVRETIIAITVDRQSTLYHFIFVAPENDYKRLEPVFQQTAQSIKFSR